MASLKALIETLITFLQRHPGLVALFGFVSGVASFLLVERQESLARIIALLMLVSWLLLVLENSLQRSMARWLRIEIPPQLLRYATQMVHQESLFFVLPFFIITTTWLSGQIIYTLLLIASAIISVTDPIYNRIAARRWLYISYHAFTLFAVLLATLPLIFKLATPESYALALLISVLLSFPSLSGVLPAGKWWRAPVLISVTMALCYVGWQARLWVPPATLWLTHVAVSEEIDNEHRAPGVGLKTIADRRMHADGLYAYTAIRAPQGLNERIYHVWLRNGEEIDRIPIDISGGRKEGYRAWTHKRNFPAQSDGDWQVQVLTEAGQMIGRLRFHVAAPNLGNNPLAATAAHTEVYGPDTAQKDVADGGVEGIVIEEEMDAIPEDVQSDSNDFASDAPELAINPAENDLTAELKQQEAPQESQPNSAAVKDSPDAFIDSP